MWYVVLALVLFVLVLFIKSFRKINRISREGTLLVAFTKGAMPKTYLGEEIPSKEQYEKLMRACYLFNKFIKGTQGMRANYYFSIRENGPIYGKTISVQLIPFISTVKKAIDEKTAQLPIDYRDKIARYMSDPFSEEGKHLSEEAISIFSKDDLGSSFLKKIRADYIRNMMDMDFMFTLFK